MILSRTKPNINGEAFHRRYSELSDEVRAKNKREDRLLDIRLKYYEREKNIRLNILYKNRCQLERTRSQLIEEWNRIQDEKQRPIIPKYITEKRKLSDPVLQLSTPELFKTDLEEIVHTVQTQSISSIQHDLSTKSTKIIRPHSAV